MNLIGRACALNIRASGTILCIAEIPGGRIPVHLMIDMTFFSVHFVLDQLQTIVPTHIDCRADIDKGGKPSIFIFHKLAAGKIGIYQGAVTIRNVACPPGCFLLLVATSIW